MRKLTNTELQAVSGGDFAGMPSPIGITKRSS